MADLRLSLIGVGSIKSGELIDYLSDYWLPRSDFLFVELEGLSSYSRKHISASYPDPVYSSVYSDALFLSDYFEALKCSQAKKDTRKSGKLCEELIRIPRLALLAATVLLLEQFIGTQLVKIFTAFFGNPKVHSV